MDTIDNAILALTANIEFKNAIKQLKNFEKKNGEFGLNVTTDKLEEAYNNFVKKANKNTVQAFNFSNETGNILSMTKQELKGDPKVDAAFYNDFYSKLEKYTARMERADKFVKDMVEALGKSEEQILGMISRMSPTDINKLAGNKYSEYDTWSNKRDRAKFKRGYNYSEKAEERADRVAIKREDQGTRAFKNAYVGKDFTEAEQKGIDSIIGKVDDKDLQKILKDYLELETILKRVETEKDKLSQIDNKDEATLKQILQLTADASRLRMLMGQDIIKSNGAMQKFAESNKELKLVDPEIETSENRKKKMQEARKPLILFYQQELEREAQDATDSIIKMFKEAFEKAKASISESADTFSSLGNIDKSVRKYIQNINTTKDAEEKLLEVSEKLKGSKGIISSENIEYAKDGIGYLRRYVELGGDINKLYDRISPSMKQFFENFSNGQVAPEFMSEFQKIYEEVGKAKDLKIGFGVGSGEGVGNVGQVNDGLEKQTQIVEKLGEEYKNVAKYAVGAEEALAKVEELAKRSNSKKGITDLERKDMIGYAARFNAINTDDNLTFSEVAQKAIEENQKKYYATADKVAEMSKKLSSSASGTGNGVGGITPEQLKTLTGYLQQIIDKLKEIKDLSNNKTPLFNDGDIKTFTQGMQEAIDKLDFSKVSESIEKINFKAISEEAERAIITIAEKFETLGEQIAQSIANGINNGAKEVKVEDTVVPKKEKIKEEKPKTEIKLERKAITVEDLDKEIERYSELKTKIDECDVELEKIKSKRKEPIISPEDIEGIETYLHKLAQVNDSKSSMYDTSSDDNFNFISKDNSDELSKLEISLDNLIQKCEPLKNFTFDFEQFASAEEASAALTTALEQELSVLKQEDPELERQITALSNSRTIMSSQLSNSVSSITNMKKELGVDTTVLDLDEAVNKLNTLDREIVDCEEKIRSLKETEKVNLVSDQDIQQMKQLNEVFRGIKYNPRSFDVAESWQEFDTMLSKSNINEEIKTKLSNTAREIAQTSSMTGNPVSIQKQILDMLQREITEQESLVSANKDKVTVENEEVVVAQNRLTQLQQEKSELQETVNLMKEKLQLQSAATSQPSNQILVSSGNTPSSNQKLQESKKYVNEIRQGFMNIVGNVSKKETLEKFPELAEFKNRRSIDEARNFLDTDEWNDFLSTLPQAHTYLESIGYDFERIYKLSDEEIKWFKGLSPEALLEKSWLTDKNGNPLKENYQEIRRAFKATQTDTSSPAIESQNKLQEELKETQEQATRTKQVVESVQSTGNKNGILSDSTTSSSPSKLGVTKSTPIVETDNSQEITREQQALTSLGEYIGQVIKLVNEKTAAFEKEQQVVDGSIQREITALTELSGWLVSVKEDVDKITTAIANLPSIDIKADLSGLDPDKLTEDVVKKFSELSKALNNTDTSNISAEGISALNGLDVSKTAGDNLQKVANAITNIKVSLNNLGDGGKSFIEDIKEIVNAGEALKNFNEILKKTKTERKEAAKQATGQSEDKPKTKTQQSNELYGAISVKQKENIKQMRNLLSNTHGVAEEAQRIIDANNVEIKQLEEKIKQQNLFNEKKEAELQVNRDNIAIQELNIQDKKAQNSDKESWIAVNSIKLKDVNLNEVEKLGDDWKIALQQTAEYKDVLGECYDITKQIRRDSKGNYLESYRLTGEKGSVVLGRDGTYLHSNMKVSSAYSDKKQSEKDAEIYNANTSKREENQRKAEVESASNIQKSVWESILQIRTQISDLELKDDQLNDNKIESLKQEESLLQSIYNDQTRILKAKATQKELESQNTALSKLGIKGKNAEEKVIENAIVNKAKEEKMLNDAYAMNADYDKKKAASSTKDNRKEIIAQYNKLISLEKELTTLRTRQQAGIGSQYDIDKTEQEIARRKEIIENLKQTTSYTQKETDAQTEYNNKVKELQELFNTNSKALGNSQVTDFINRLGNINVLGLEQNIQDTYTQIGKLTDKFSEGKITVTDYQKQVGNLVIALENVKKVIEPNNINLGKSELEQYFAENGAQVKKVSTSKDGKTLTVDATKYDGVNKSLKELVGTYDLVTGRVSVFERKTSSAMTNLQKSLAAFKGKLQAVFRYLTTFVGVYEIIGAIKSGISTVIEFDTALSEMRKVSSASTATLKELQKESFNVADEVGSTALQIQKSTADFLRLGKSQQKLWLAPLYRNV